MIEVRNLSVAYGGVSVLSDCSLTVARGEHAALMGPSGCGKTTLLRCIAGLRKPDAGSAVAEGRVSAVFQEPRLFPWLTAAQNIALVSPGDTDRWLRPLGLAEAADRYPAELSGGMRQRLSIARALAYGGDILLLDEPFKGMDAALRSQVSALIRREWAGKTLLLVTHEQSDLAADDTLYLYEHKRFFRQR